MLTALEKAKANGADDRHRQPAARGRAPRALREPADHPQGTLEGAATHRRLFLQIRPRRRPGPLPRAWQIPPRGGGAGEEDTGAIRRSRRPRVHRRTTPRGYRRVPAATARRRRLGQTSSTATGLSPGTDRRGHGRTILLASHAHHRLLGHGPHPAQALRAHASADVVNLLPAPRQHRSPRRRRVPRPRPLERAGRPHDGHRSKRRPTPSSTPWRRSSASPRHASTATTSYEPSARLRDGDAKVFFAHGRQLRRRPPPTPRCTEAAMRRARLTVHVSTKLEPLARRSPARAP